MYFICCSGQPLLQARRRLYTLPASHKVCDQILQQPASASRQRATALHHSACARISSRTRPPFFFFASQAGADGFGQAQPHATAERRGWGQDVVCWGLHHRPGSLADGRHRHHHGVQRHAAPHCCCCRHHYSAPGDRCGQLSTWLTRSDPLSCFAHLSFGRIVVSMCLHA